MNAGVSGGDKALEQWVRHVRFTMELGVKLAGNEERVLRHFDDLHQLAVWREPAKGKTGLLKFITIRVIELVAMPVAFINHEGPVQPGGFCAHRQLARLRAE